MGRGDHGSAGHRFEISSGMCRWNDATRRLRPGYATDMPGLWTNSGADWELQPPTGFPDEKTLHQLVANAPQILPLAGAPEVTIVGSEVRLGGGFADLIGVEDSGRPVVIEVKLGSNAEARRAVVAQALAYAAHIQGTDADGFNDILARHLADAGHASVTAAVLAQDQEGAVEESAFLEGLETHLAEGRFRLVLVLDDAPADLVRLVSYLKSITTDRLAVDLITVATYEVGGATVLLPQRVDSERVSLVEAVPRVTGSAGKGEVVPGADEFEQSIAAAPREAQPELQRLLTWGRNLEGEGLVRLATFRSGVGNRWTLLPRLQPDNVGLVTLWNDRGRPYVSLWRTVFERSAPDHIELVESATGVRLGQGNTVHKVSDEALAALTDAYRTAAHSG